MSAVAIQLKKRIKSEIKAIEKQKGKITSLDVKELIDFLEDLASKPKISDVQVQNQPNLQQFWQKQELEPSKTLSQEEVDKLSYVS